jgi:hypothetical protein
MKKYILFLMLFASSCNIVFSMQQNLNNSENNQQPGNSQQDEELEMQESKESSEEETEKCAVCYNEFSENKEENHSLKCNHTFHVNCIKKWIDKKEGSMSFLFFLADITCPICKKNIEKNECKEINTKYKALIAKSLLLPKIINFMLPICKKMQPFFKEMKHNFENNLNLNNKKFEFHIKFFDYVVIKLYSHYTDASDQEFFNFNFSVKNPANNNNDSSKIQINLLTSNTENSIAEENISISLEDDENENTIKSSITTNRLDELMENLRNSNATTFKITFLGNRNIYNNEIQKFFKKIEEELIFIQQNPEYLDLIDLLKNNHLLKALLGNMILHKVQESIIKTKELFNEMRQTLSEIERQRTINLQQIHEKIQEMLSKIDINMLDFI